MPGIRVGRRGQITIPSAIRRELQLEEGSHLILQLKEGQLTLKPAGRSIIALRGSVPVEGTQDFDAIKAEVLAKRFRRFIDDAE
ncbi:MAG: AbrB/MazE/SpoVT family DNA-binding domain-containing protein [Thermoleophilia bacterium]|nr:AbrB/MazE/SpoVT family DNA-binding domain-containing protein [Thermoleophilia bacterium]